MRKGLFNVPVRWMSRRRWPTPNGPGRLRGQSHPPSLSKVSTLFPLRMDAPHCPCLPLWAVLLGMKYHLLVVGPWGCSGSDHWPCHDPSSHFGPTPNLWLSGLQHVHPLLLVPALCTNPCVDMLLLRNVHTSCLLNGWQLKAVRRAVSAVQRAGLSRGSRFIQDHPD